MRFRRYIALDWSGAKRANGVAVAKCTSGRGAPQLVPIARGNRWRREDARDWLSETITTDGSVLIGLDFAFAFPWEDAGCYFPDGGVDLDDAAALWKRVEEVCGEDKDLYAGSFTKDKRFASFFWKTGHGQARFRCTEKCCKPKPECVFKLVGPKQVGKASLSGMRLLHQLKARHGDAIKVWPFDPDTDTDSVCVEIFPTHFIARAGMRPRKIRDLYALNKVLAHYESDPVPKDEEKRSDHDTDALISAAALRHLAGDAKLWCPKAMTPDVARREGWIFGVE